MGIRLVKRDSKGITRILQDERRKKKKKKKKKKKVNCACITDTKGRYQMP
jgi:hypothetical protein